MYAWYVSSPRTNFTQIKDISEKNRKIKDSYIKYNSYYKYIMWPLGKHILFLTRVYQKEHSKIKNLEIRKHN